MAERFQSFVILAEMRTGSNFLEANLNALPGVICYGEAFNAKFIGAKDQTDLLGVTLAQRIADPKVLLQRMRERTTGLPGFRYFSGHEPRILDEVMDDRRCAKIILTRNPVESYISRKIADATGQWKLTNVAWVTTTKVRFDEQEFLDYLGRLCDAQARLLRRLQVSGQAWFYIDYEDIASVEVLNGLAAFLGVEGRLKTIDDTLKRQNPVEIEDKVENPEDMRAALARIDSFGLNRTPNFEPRRSAAVPTAVAAAGAPVLFMSVPCAPVAQVTGWLASLGTGGVVEGFEQKSLRQWKRAHPGHRSFTVVRHPLRRAYAAFRHLVVAGGLPGLRRQLVRAHNAVLPEPGEAFADPAAERAAFLVFLDYARWAVVGQTGMRVDPNLASQTAVVQGFAGFQPVDLIIREDRLAEGLAYLAAEVGITAPVIGTDADDSGLTAIHDATVERAAAEAYQRDYVGFGFGLWRA